MYAVDSREILVETSVEETDRGMLIEDRGSTQALNSMNVEPTPADDEVVLDNNMKTTNETGMFQNQDQSDPLY